MTHYIDGFVFPLARARLPAYVRLAEAVAEIWKELGALEYLEHLGDDMSLEGTASFTELTGASDDEAVIFGWVVFESREARDLANEKVAADPRVAELLAELDSGFDAKRMAYGGFRSLVGALDD